MKKILITGGAGFIGSHLCQKLVENGDKVICLDNFYTGSKDSVKNLLGCENFESVQHDVVKEYSADVEQIYNLACPASPVHYQRDSIKTMETSVLGIMNMLKLACNNKARILQASTSEVYGDPKIHPQTEDYWGNANPIGVRSCYDEGKRAAESLMFDYKRQKSADIKVVRIFNTYGPNMAQDDGRVVSNFIVQALKGEDITIYGDGSQTRSFCYVDDLTDGLIKMMNTADFTGPVNLGSNFELPIIEFANIIIELTGTKSKIVFMPLPKDDPAQRRPDLTLAAEKLDWSPKTDLKTGIKKTVDYFDEKLRGKI